MKFLDGAHEVRRVPRRCPCGRPEPEGPKGTTVATVQHYCDYARGPVGPITVVVYHHPGGLRCRWERATVTAKRWTHSLVRPA